MSDIKSDQLCQDCAKVDLFSLFTGPRYFPNHIDGKHPRGANLGTLKNVKANAKCPLCRLIKHALYGSVDEPIFRLWHDEREPDDASVKCVLRPVRQDYGEETKYQEPQTRDLLATKMRISLEGVSGCSQREYDLICNHYALYGGFQLLSPDFTDPQRPLMNGFRITTMEESLQLLSQWLRTCRDNHKEICRDDDLPTLTPLRKIRVIDVQNREIVERHIEGTQYAALSYVWGENKDEHLQLAGTLFHRLASLNATGVLLPHKIPKVIEDALYVCIRLSIPYLWVDLYCIDQQDPDRKFEEIRGMGQIYRSADITFIDGHSGELDPTVSNGTQRKETGLLPDRNFGQVCNLQRTEVISGRQYITSLPDTHSRVRGSTWSRRSWTYQEGQLAKRVALFNSLEITYMCGAGTWYESTHSGHYGHRADLPEIDLRSNGFHILRAKDWLRRAKWDFAEYETILLGYTGRELSFESDKLNAIAGCFDIIAQKKGLQFLYGLPSIDFHYALLWTGEQDRPRDAFPSWSWAGWHSIGQHHWLQPFAGTSGCLVKHQGAEIFEHQGPASLEIELDGPVISGIEDPHPFNRCLQRLAVVRIHMNSSTISINSEVSHFSIDIDPSDTEGWKHKLASSYHGNTVSDSENQAVDSDNDYLQINRSLILRDSIGNQYADPRSTFGESSYRPWPHFRLCLPRHLHRSTVTWLLRDGIDLVNILDLELLEGDAAGDPLPTRRVFFLGIDRRQGQARRFGMGWMTRKMWDAANPNTRTVELF